MKPFEDANVEAIFSGYPPHIRTHLLTLRNLIFETAANTPGVGKLEETLKWGEPSYLTSETKSGSTIRIHHRAKDPYDFAMYFHCQTHLINTFRALFPHTFTFGDNRALEFMASNPIPTQPLIQCIKIALTYHLNKKNIKKESCE